MHKRFKINNFLLKLDLGGMFGHTMHVEWHFTSCFGKEKGCAFIIVLCAFQCPTLRPAGLKLSKRKNKKKNIFYTEGTVVWWLSLLPPRKKVLTSNLLRLSLHVLPMSSWVSFGYSSFLSSPKTIRLGQVATLN